MSRIPTAAVLLAAAVLFLPSQSVAADRWVGSWGCAPQLSEPANRPPAPGLSGNTLRQTVRTTVGGKKLRLRFSNAYGDAPLSIEAVQIALSGGGAAIRPGTGKMLKFQGAASITIPAGMEEMSDAIGYSLPPMADVSVTIRFGQTPAAVTGHPGSRSTSYLQAGNAIDVADMAQAARTTHWYVLTGIDVVGGKHAASVVIPGDSITDGRGSTTDGNDRWTDFLARRLGADAKTASISVLNEGLGGNAILRGGLGPPLMKRFDHDVFGQSSAQWVILLEGVNDIGVSSSATVADDLIAAMGPMIDRAHGHGLRVYGVPILPFGRSMYSSAAHEAARQRVNEWIRSSGKFDAVIDMDEAVRDPANPANLLPIYDTGDHLHLNPAGYRKMAESIDLKLFARP